MSMTSWKLSSSLRRRNQSSQVSELPTTKQQRMSSDPMMPTQPTVKNVMATPNARKDSRSIRLPPSELDVKSFRHSLPALAVLQALAGNVPDDGANDDGK